MTDIKGATEAPHWCRETSLSYKCRWHLTGTARAQFNIFKYIFSCCVFCFFPSLFHTSCAATDLSNHKKIRHPSQGNMVSALIYSPLCMRIKLRWRVPNSLSPSLTCLFLLVFFQTLNLQKQLKKQWLEGSQSWTHYCQLIVFTWTEAITLIYGVSNKYVKNKKVLKKKV